MLQQLPGSSAGSVVIVNSGIYRDLHVSDEVAELALAVDPRNGLVQSALADRFVVSLLIHGIELA